MAYVHTPDLRINSASVDASIHASNSRITRGPRGENYRRGRSGMQDRGMTESPIPDPESLRQVSVTVGVHRERAVVPGDRFGLHLEPVGRLVAMPLYADGRA